MLENFFIFILLITVIIFFLTIIYIKQFLNKKVFYLKYKSRKNIYFIFIFTPLPLHTKVPLKSTKKLIALTNLI